METLFPWHATILQFVKGCSKDLKIKYRLYSCPLQITLVETYESNLMISCRMKPHTGRGQRKVQNLRTDMKPYAEQHSASSSESENTFMGKSEENRAAVPKQTRHKTREITDSKKSTSSGGNLEANRNQMESGSSSDEEVITNVSHRL